MLSPKKPIVSSAHGASNVLVSRVELGDRIGRREGKQRAEELANEYSSSEPVAFVLGELCVECSSATSSTQNEALGLGLVQLLNGVELVDLMNDVKSLESTYSIGSSSSGSGGGGSKKLGVDVHEDARGSTTSQSEHTQQADAGSSTSAIQAAEGEASSSTLLLYPAAETSTAGVVTLQTRVSQGGARNAVDSFLNNLTAAYRGTTRAVGEPMRLKISLISDEGTGGPLVQPLDFFDEKDYWGCICAITKSVVRQADVRWSAACTIPAAEAAQTTAAGDTVRKGILNLLKGGTSGAVASGYRVEVTATLLTITDLAANASLVSLDLKMLRAIAITSDFVPPKPYLMEIGISEHSEVDNRSQGGLRVALVGTDLEPILVNEGYSRRSATFSSSASTSEAAKGGAGIEEHILLPLSLDEVQNAKTNDGLTSIAVLSGTRYTGVANTIAAINTIPFHSFLTSRADAVKPSLKAMSNNKLPATRAAASSSSSTSSSAAAATKRGQAPSAATAETLSLPYILLDEPIVTSLSVSQAAPRRAARVHLVGATCLVSSMMHTPSSYCTMHLLDDKGQRIGMSGESKTDVIKTSASPTWDKEFLLQGNEEGVDGVSGVMLTIKDTGRLFGGVKSTPLGQVFIPIGCFIQGIEARLCLPLEPTPRMNPTNTSLGELHVITQLVTVEGTSAKNNQPSSPSSRLRSISFSPSLGLPQPPSPLTRKETPGNASVPLFYLLHPALPLSVNWPFRVLGGGAGIASGHIACGFSNLILYLSPGAGGLLTNCSEGKGRQGVVVLDWEQLTGAVAITESAVMVSFIVHKLAGPGGAKKGHAQDGKSQGSTFSALAELEILVAPCPARLLQQGLLSRVPLSSVRNELLAFNKEVISANQMYTRGSAASLLDTLLPQARAISRALDSTIATSCIKTKNSEDDQHVVSSAASLLFSSSCAPAAIDAVQLSASKFLTQARARLYQGQLLQCCRSIRGNESWYTIAHVRNLVATDCEAALEAAPLSAAALAFDLRSRHKLLLEAALHRLKDFVLCSADHWHGQGELDATHQQQQRQQQSSLARWETGPEPTCSALTCFSELLNGYHTALRQLLAPYLGSPEAFKRTPGQEAKMTLLRLLVEHDESLDVGAKAILSMLGLTLSPRLLLLDKGSTIQDVVAWYGASLETETQQWLSKTVQHASIFKTNTHNHPWDYEEIGGHVCSSLPIDLQTQMNQYLNLLKEGGGLANEDDEGNETHRIASQFRIQGKIVDAVGRCMLLLSDEYRRALQTRHWDRSDRPGDNQGANMLFLMSVVNDCFRVSGFQITHSKQHGDGTLSDVHYHVISAFSKTSDVAIRHLVRILFSDMHELLVDFTAMWADVSKSPFRALSQKVRSFVRVLRTNPRLEEHYVLRTVAAIADTVALRYLLMLKERASLTQRCSAQEVVRFGADIEALNALFADLCQGANSVTRQMQYLQDAFDLLSMPASSQPLAALIKVTARSYLGDVSSAGGAFLNACVLVLRPGDASKELTNAVTSAISEAEKIPASWNPQERQRKLQAQAQARASREAGDFGPGEHDLIVSIFAPAASSTTAHGGDAVLKHFREAAANLGTHKKDRKTEEKDLHVLRMLGLDLDHAINEEVFGGGGGGGGGGAAGGGGGDGGGEDMSDDERTSVSGSVFNAFQHMDEADLVQIQISRIEVRGLKTASLFGGCNPYIAISLGGQRQKTAVVWNAKGGACKWKNVTLTFKFPKDRLAHARLLVRVYDKERIRRKRLLGGTSLLLSGLALYRVESWLALSGGDLQQDGAECFINVDVAGR